MCYSAIFLFSCQQPPLLQLNNSATVDSATSDMKPYQWSLECENDPRTPPTFSTNHNSVHHLVDITSFSISWLDSVAMAAARFLLRSASSKGAISNVNGGVHSCLGITLVKLSPSGTSCSRTQRRHNSHFTFQPDPVPTQYGNVNLNVLVFLFLQLTCFSFDYYLPDRNR